MILHEIHDLSDSHVSDLLVKGLSEIDESADYAKNYHPNFRNEPSNVFNVIDSGRYQRGKGKYFVLEKEGELVTCAGWNEYEIDPTVALAMTRGYTNPKYRVQYYIHDYILPKIIEETVAYKHLYLTFNTYNRALYTYFAKASQHNGKALGQPSPPLFQRFKPLGKQSIYYTEQYVLEFDRDNK